MRPCSSRSTGSLAKRTKYRTGLIYLTRIFFFINFDILLFRAESVLHLVGIEPKLVMNKWSLGLLVPTPLTI